MTSKKEANEVSAKRFQVDLPEEVLSAFGWTDAEVPQKVREALVMELLRKHAISQGRAAELLGFSRWDLYEVMGRYQVPAIELTPEELKREIAEEIKGGKGI
jgi:predicted HTH domain antitoxin